MTCGASCECQLRLQTCLLQISTRRLLVPHPFGWRGRPVVSPLHLAPQTEAACEIVDCFCCLFALPGEALQVKGLEKPVSWGQREIACLHFLSGAEEEESVARHLGDVRLGGVCCVTRANTEVTQWPHT